MKKYIWLAVLLFVFFSTQGQVLIIQLNGEINFDNSQISIDEAGLDFPSSIESEPTVNISVLYNDNSNTKINPNQKWRIFINKSDLVWSPDLTMEAIRTGTGENVGSHGVSTISDGESYQEITDVPSYFFKGRSETAYIPLQFRISGLSVVLGATDYETNIVFTVYDDW